MAARARNHELIDTGTLLEENERLQRERGNLVATINRMKVENKALQMVVEKQIDELARHSRLLFLAEIHAKQVDPGFSMKSLLKK